MFYSLCSDVSVTGLDGITAPTILNNRNFYCTGDESRLANCVITNINRKFCGNKRVGLMCVTGIIHKIVCILYRKMLQLCSQKT